jgi:CDP-diacylglycerol--serine O-phosphatidyltransferase
MPIKTKRIKARKQLRQGIYLLPNLFTTANLFAGCFSLINTLNGNYQIAVIAIFVAVFLDGVDGKVARLTNAASNFGKDYDSLSDLVSFGVAPALLFYFWGLNNLSTFINVWEKTAWLMSFFYIVSMALRLARFNNQLQFGNNSYFTGLPSPAAATFVAVILWQCEILLLDPKLSFSVLMSSVIIAAALMVSKVPFYSFKSAQSMNRIPFANTIMIPLIFILILLEPPLVLTVMASTYVASGPINILVRFFNKLYIRSQKSSHSE